MNIVLRKHSIGYEKFIYQPISESDLKLMQHCINEDLIYLNEDGLDKVRYIAAAHDWKIEVIE